MAVQHKPPLAGKLTRKFLRANVVRTNGSKNALDGFAGLPAAEKFDLKNGAPRALSGRDIHRLLADHGRHEIHFLIGECIQNLTRWRQLVNVCNASTDMNADFTVEVRANYRLWKHRMAILDLISGGQEGVQWEARSK